MRSVLLSTSVAVLCLLAVVLFAFVPRVAVAQSTVPGVTCTVINGAYVCTQQGTGGTICVNDDTTGTQVCENAGTGGTSSGGSTSLGTGLGSTNQPSLSSGGTGWLSKLTNWFASAINTVFDAVVAFLKDLVTYCVAVMLSLVSAAINAIGSPSWLQSYSLQGILSPAMSALGFFLGALQFPAAFALIGLGYVFRLTRKFLTLFQW